jgi:hypothetical protein
MIYLPWIAFALAILYMIREGDKARREYLSRQRVDELRDEAMRHPRAAASGMGQQLPATAYGQSQTTDPGKTYGFAGGSQGK